MGEVIHLLKPILLNPAIAMTLRNPVAAKAEIRWFDDAEGVPFIRVTVKDGENIVLERDVEMGRDVTVDLSMKIRKNR